MIVIFVLLPLAVILAGGFVLMFVWATRDGQFEDVQTPQLRVLFDDRPVSPRAEHPSAAAKGERERI